MTTSSARATAPQLDVICLLGGSNLGRGFLGKPASHHDLRSILPHPFIVKLAVINSKDLPRTVNYWFAGLCDDERSRLDEPADGEQMPVSSFPGRDASCLCSIS